MADRRLDYDFYFFIAVLDWNLVVFLLAVFESLVLLYQLGRLRIFKNFNRFDVMFDRISLIKCFSTIRNFTVSSLL